MQPTKRLARQAGFLYLLLIPFGAFGILFIPIHFIEPDNIIKTMDNIASDQFLFRLGIVSGLVTQLIQILVVLALYQLLKSVNKIAADLMVISILIAVPIAMLNELNHFAVLVSLGNAEQVELFLSLHEYGVNIAQIFWGIWLLPMGYLVYKSGFIPRIIGILLVFAGSGYLMDSFMIFLNLDPGFVFSDFTCIGEITLVLWLLIKGLKTA